MLSVAHWVDRRALLSPKRMALIGEKCRLSYAELAMLTNQMARALRDDYGIRAGERVAVLAHNSIHYLMVYIALAKLKAVIVPLNIRLTVNELIYQVEDSGSLLLLYSPDMKAKASSLKDTESLERLELLSAEPGDAPGTGFEGVYRQQSAISISAESGSDDPFIICYTSGTTGKPKGAVLTHGNIYWNALNNVLALDMTSADNVLTILPLFHIGGTGLFAFPALFVGGTVTIPHCFEPTQTLSIIERERVTIMMGVPTIFQMLFNTSEFCETDFSSVRWLCTGGAPCPLELLQDYHQAGLPFTQGYGLTESAPTVFMLSSDDYKRKVGSIGKPVMFCETRIVDAAGVDVSEGEVGELWIKGPNVIRYYWKLPDKTAESFHNGWFKTGDLMKVDEEGFVYVVGRKKDMIISGGENVYPLEIEQVLNRYPGVTETAVIGIPDSKWGEVPIAFVAVGQKFLEIKANENETATALHRFCQQYLAKYKCPQHYVFLEELPKNATGKIDKLSLKTLYLKKEVK